MIDKINNETPRFTANFGGLFYSSSFLYYNKLTKTEKTAYLLQTLVKCVPPHYYSVKGDNACCFLAIFI